jgi:cysteine desulfurase/selenocysteine lyase
MSAMSQKGGFFSPERLEAARALFPHTRTSLVYFNHAATGPLSARVLAAMAEHLRGRSEGTIDTYPTDLSMVGECRAMVSRLINAPSPDRIAFTANTSDALNIVAAGIPWKQGDRVVLNDIEFPANVYPYLNLKRLGVELDIIPAPDGIVTAPMVADAVTPRTRLVALSAVQFLSGHRADLAAIGGYCRGKGIIFAVDGMQAVGAVRIDVQAMHIDALAAGAQKWLMGPHGSGFLFLTEELQSRISQAYLGWLSPANPWEFHDFTQPLAPTARRYEGGSLNMASLWGFQASLATLLEFDPAAIEAHILALTGALMDGLRSIGGLSVVTPAAAAERAGIVTVGLSPDIDGSALLSQLSARRVSIAMREGKLRFSPHFYNTPEEVAAVVNAVRDSIRTVGAGSPARP